METMIRAKRYNCTTSGTVIEAEVDAKARRAIDACFHLTPATDVDLDNLIGIGTTETDNKPDRPDMAEEDHGNWDDETIDPEESQGPTEEELRAGQRRGE